MPINSIFNNSISFSLPSPPTPALPPFFVLLLYSSHSTFLPFSSHSTFLPSSYAASSSFSLFSPSLLRTLPEGGVLIFLTGRQEVNRLCSELRRAFPVRGSNPNCKRQRRTRRKSKSISEKTEQSSSSLSTSAPSSATPSTLLPPKINLDNYLIIPEDEESALIGDGDEVRTKEDTNVHDDDEEDDFMEDDGGIGGGIGDVAEGSRQALQSADSPPLHVLPLYSLLSPERQRLVFAPPPEGHRLCVVATNVAETSLTIPGVRYVVDCGKVKVNWEAHQEFVMIRNDSFVLTSKFISLSKMTIYL